jgi:hypothetical protein
MVDHPIIIRGANLTQPIPLAASTPPTILLRTDSKFIPAILDGLRSDSGRQALAQTEIRTQTSINVRDKDHVLKLFQPVHQIFNVALVQLMCDTFGSPRLDPRKIDSCGLVIRRMSDADPNLLERWSKGDQIIQGWIPCSDDDLDPDPTRRRPVATTGNGYIDGLMPIPSPMYAPFSESVAPMFVAPPAVCAVAKATVLYGLVPVTSVERSEAEPATSFSSDFVRTHLPYFLRPEESRTIPGAGRTVGNQDAEDVSLTAVITILKQLKFEFGVFRDDSSNGKAIFQALNEFSVQGADGNEINKLGNFLKSASEVLVDLEPGENVLFPTQWPTIDEAQCAAIATLIQNALEARLASHLAGEERYESTDRRYKLRAFARVKRGDGCPPTIHWTPYSEPFQIAAWHESAGLPPIKITLPYPTKDFLRSVKPNVSFAMPAELFNMLQVDPKQTLKGSPSAGGGSVGILWICSFSLPIITICAFIVLNLFLSLFDLVFQWLLFIKICIPVPVPKKTNG